MTGISFRVGIGRKKVDDAFNEGFFRAYHYHPDVFPGAELF